MNLFRGHDALTFKDAVEFVGFQILQSFHYSRRPVNLDTVDLGALVQSKVNSRVVHGKIATAALNFRRLRHSAGHDFQSRSDGHAVALRSGQFETHPMTTAKPVI